MWISSQNEKRLLNANNFSLVKNINSVDIITESECYQEGECIVLGEYKSEKRAKEVLGQIRSQIETSISMDTVYKGVRTVSETVFQMPKE